jgi:hypothetical protein
MWRSVHGATAVILSAAKDLGTTRRSRNPEILQSPLGSIRMTVGAGSSSKSDYRGALRLISSMPALAWAASVVPGKAAMISSYFFFASSGLPART